MHTYIYNLYVLYIKPVCCKKFREVLQVEIKKVFSNPFTINVSILIFRTF